MLTTAQLFYLAPKRVVTPVTPVPELVGFAGNQGGNPSLPAHIAGDLIIDVGSTGTSQTIPTAAAGTVWDSEVHATQNAAIAAYYRAAAGPGQSTAWTGTTGARASWVFRNAAIDQIAIAQGTGTTLDFPELTGMTADSLVGVYVLSRGAQTAVATIAAGLLSGGFTQRIARNISAAAWVGDTNVTLLSSFNPANQTFDTNTAGWMALAFSVKSAT